MAIGILDAVIIFAYFIGIMVFGTFFTRYITSTKEFFTAGQRFAWWVTGFSCVSLCVGSYSFIKYAEAGYKYGISSTQAYLNDWPWIPLFIFGWLPIIYFSKVLSIPEYFEKRFDEKSRAMICVLMLMYTIGYIGINLVTLGVALNTLIGWPVMFGAAVTAIIMVVYVTAGGQVAVIMTDLVQAIILLLAGIGLFVGGLYFLGSHGAGFWSNLPLDHKFAFSFFNKPPEFNAIGIYWQDGIANTACFWFINQGLILRYFSCKSVREGRKAMLFAAAILMPLATIAVSNTGWIARAMENAGLIHLESAKEAFVAAGSKICTGIPGLFGFIMAALLAALMSTADALINAASALFTNDFWKRYIRPAAPDRQYLLVARITSLVACFIGLILVPVYMKFATIYQAHAAFTAAIAPPMVVTVFLAFLWKRFTSTAAFATLCGGLIAIFASIAFPQLITPFTHGVNLAVAKGGSYMRACYGIVICLAIGVVVTLLTKPKPKEEIVTLTIGGEKEAREKFKGGKINLKPGKKGLVEVKHIEPAEKVTVVRVDPQVMKKMAAEKGDLLYVNDRRWWYGGLHSVHVKAGQPIAEAGDFGKIYLSRALIKEGRFKEGEKVVVEKIM